MKVEANPLRIPSGRQPYPPRESIAEEFEGNLFQIAGSGFRLFSRGSAGGRLSLTLPDHPP